MIPEAAALFTAIAYSLLALYQWRGRVY